MKKLKKLSVGLIPFVLKDACGNQVHGVIEISESGIAFHFDGYGDKCTVDGAGKPLWVEVYEGELRVLAWSDINLEEPTHTISMEASKVSNRQD